MRSAKLPSSTWASAVVFLAIDGLELDDVAGPEEHHRIAQMRQALARLEDRRGRHAEHLITAGAAHGINAAEATAMSHRVPGRVGAWPQVLRHLQLTLALDHLEHEGQAGHETHHGHEPGRAGMRVDEGLHRRKAVDACGVFQIGGCRVLVPLAKAHQRLVRPRVVVVDRDFDDARVQAEVGCRCCPPARAAGPAARRRDAIGVVAHLIGCVGRADLGHAVDRALAQRAGDGHALEEGFQRHVLADLGEDEFVAAMGVAHAHRCSSRSARIQASSQFVW